MCDICLEYLSIGTKFSELEINKEYYGLEEGITTDWMIEEAKYQLSCYYEDGHSRCDDRFLGEYEYKVWVSESGKLKRLISTLEKVKSILIVEWQ